jgi:hypothetical protein
MPTPLRHMRIPDELWDAAMAKADAEGTSVSDVVRELLSRWVKRPARQR